MDVEIAEQPPAQVPVSTRIGGLLAGLVGAGVGIYAGMNLLIPLGLAGMVALLLAKAVPPPNKPMLAASAQQGGHSLWMLWGMIPLSQYGLNLQLKLSWQSSDERPNTFY